MDNGENFNNGQQPTQEPVQPVQQPVQPDMNQQPNNGMYGPQPTQPEDKGSFGWAVLGFFIPLVGLILFLAWKKDKPNSAKKAGIGALVSVIVSVVMSIVMTFLGAALFGGIVAGLEDANWTVETDDETTSSWDDDTSFGDDTSYGDDDYDVSYDEDYVTMDDEPAAE